MLNLRLSIALALGAFLLAAPSCGDDDEIPTGPVAGTLNVRLTTPHADDGALLIRIDGPDMTHVTSAAPELYSRFLETFEGADSEVTAVFVGDVGSGTLFTFRVPDASRVDAYVGTVLQVADRANELRESLAGYKLSIVGGS